jgi:F420-dependent oxidoreductase-like protein
MRIGLQIPDFSWPGSPQHLGPDLARIARNAEAAGMSSLWVMDHFFQIKMVGPPEHEMLEAYTTLAHLAAATERVTVGAMVTGVTYRQPGLLVKTVTTLDVLSGGRAWLGIGAAWNEEEHRGLGIPFPPLAERFERLEETLQIALRMWSSDESPYAGRHHELGRPLNSPQALTKPHPPILIGGGGEQKTLRLVARYADACNLFESSHDKLAHKLDVLHGHCEAVGRDYDELTRTTLGRLSLSGSGAALAQTVDEAVERFGRLADLGIDEAVVSLSDVHETETFDLVSEVVDQVHRITPQGR